MASDALLPRFAGHTVETALSDTPIVVIQGARQVGKSTLANIATSNLNTKFLTLDDPLSLSLAHDDPAALISQHPDGLLIIDEAQRAPELILPVKASVDANRRPGRFLLTGSADLLQVKGTGDSLAGRAETVELLPLSQGEIAERDSPEDFIAWLLSREPYGNYPTLDPALIIRGGYPEAVQRPPNRATRWLRDYATRLSNHDARELSSGGYADQLGGLLRYFASLGQTELVKASLARHIGVSESTVDGYWRTAKIMRLAMEFPAWNRTPHRAVARRPKAALIDTGLASALVGFTEQKANALGNREYYGNLLEQFVALELAKQRTWSEVPFEIFHYRDHKNLEVDLVIETLDGTLIAIEVKATSSPSSQHWQNLEKFRQLLPDREVVGVLLHTGDAVARLHDWLKILPITALWEH